MRPNSIRSSVMATLLVVLAGGLAAVADGPATSPSPPIDFQRARALYQRQQQGETLTPEEQAYLDRAKSERQRQNANGPATARGDIDVVRARAIYEKSQRGETLTADE